MPSKSRFPHVCLGGTVDTSCYSGPEGLFALVHHPERECVLAFRFLQYWGRIGSENNMTSCHRPVCRKEGVLLDYSKDGGTFYG